jgi:hypothetical protein
LETRREERKSLANRPGLSISDGTETETARGT